MDDMNIADNKWLEKFINILGDWIDYVELDNQFMANEMGISKRQLYRKIKKMTGETPNQFIRKYRLNKAMEFLKSDQFYTVQQLGIAVGYQNIHYFSKMFEEEFGEKPMQILIKRGHR